MQNEMDFGVSNVFFFFFTEADVTYTKTKTFNF